MNPGKKLILVSNDDGVDARGIEALARAMAPLGEVVVCAPATDQSAISHAITLSRPLRIHRREPLFEDGQEIPRHGVDGTPTDAVYIGVHHLLKERKPDLVVSGINHGGNVSNDVLYSGTVSAAMEGLFLGIPSLAFSVVGARGFDFGVAARFAQGICRRVLEDGLPEGVLLNVNVPKRCKADRYRVTVLGHHEYLPGVEERHDPRGRSYYWIGGSWGGFTDVPGTDVKAIDEGLISVTPIRVDLTARQALDPVAGLSVEGFELEPSP
jgi:5'-nucleotidase